MKRLFTSTDLRTADDLLALLRVLEPLECFPNPDESGLDRPGVALDCLRPDDMCERADELLLDGLELRIGEVLWKPRACALVGALELRAAPLTRAELLRPARGAERKDPPVLGGRPLGVAGAFDPDGDRDAFAGRPALDLPLLLAAFFANTGSLHKVKATRIATTNLKFRE